MLFNRESVISEISASNGNQQSKYNCIIAKWVRDYKNTGPDALMPHKKGRKSILRKMRVRKTKSQGKQTLVDANVEYIRELEGELQKLRLENAFLKELRRLRLEDETKMRELRKSSAVSEDHSD